MATTISKLEVELTLDSKNFEARVRGSRKALAALGLQIGKTDKKVKRHEKNVRNLGTSFRHTVVTLGLMRDAIRTAWHATGGLVRGIVDVTAEFERLNVLLTGMSKGTTAIEKATDAARQFNQVIELAKSAPFAVKEITNSWVKFRSVGIDPATGSLKALMDAVSAFGGTGDILHRATIAVQQMAGKGVISMEELRQQMGEAVPQAMVLLARGMNMSVGAMVNAISKGAVIAQPALEKLFAEFELTFGGASLALMDTYIGSLARLTTVWQLTLREMGESSGLFDVVKNAVKELIIELDTPAIRRFGIDIAVSMRRMVVALLDAINWIRENASMIGKIVKALAIWRLAMIALHLNKHSKALKALNFQIGLLSTRAGLAKIALINWRNAGATLILMTKNLTKAIKATLATNPVGWMLLIVGGLFAWWQGTRDVKEETYAALDALNRYKDAAGQGVFDESIVDLKKMNDELIRQRAIIDELFSDPPDYLSDEDVTGMVDRASKAYFELVSKFNADTKLLADSTKKSLLRAYDAIAKAAKAEVREALTETLNSVREQDTVLDTMFKKGELDEKQRLERRLVNWKEFAEVQKGVISEMLHAAINELDVLKGNSSATEEELRIAEARIDSFVAKINSSTISLENLLATLERDNDFLSEETQSAARLEKVFTTFLNRAKSKMAGLNEQLRDGLPLLAKFMTDLSNEKFGKLEDIDTAKLEAIKVLLVDIEGALKKLANKRLLEAGMKSVTAVLAKATEEAKIFQETLDAGLTEVPNNRVRRFRRTLEALRATLVAANVDMTEFNKVAAAAMSETKTVSALEKTIAIKKEIRDITLGQIVNDRDRFAQELELLEVQHQGLLATLEQGKATAELQKQYELLIEAKKKAFEDSTPMKRLLKDWEDTRGKLEASYASWMDAFVNTIVDGVRQGKIAFKELAISILADLAKIYLQALIVRAVMTMFGPTPIGKNPEIAGIDLGGFDISGAIPVAMGGVIGPGGSSPLNRYARGGIATKPQIAIFGEGDGNEAFVPLPDGRSIPVSMSGGGGGSVPDVTVNVINETGIPVDAEQSGGLEFDGESFVLDVVLTAASRPGNFRDGLKTATA